MGENNLRQFKLECRIYNFNPNTHRLIVRCVKVVDESIGYITYIFLDVNVKVITQLNSLFTYVMTRHSDQLES